MNNKLLNFFTTCALCLLAFAFPAAKAQATPSILFSPTSATIVQNNTITLTININVDASVVQTSDVTIQYTASDLDFVSATNGLFFPSFNWANDPSNNRLELHANTSSSDSRTGSGTYATVVFKAKKSSGSSTMSFVCPDTHVWTTTLIDVLNPCAQRSNIVALSYSDGSSPTVTPTPTTPAGTNPTSTPTPTPGQGGINTIPTCVILSSNTSLAVGTPLTVNFTCSGVDPDGYMSAAEFTFGDNTRDTIYKNAGSPGSISTTHTYTTIGTLGASCRVRDNNNVYSSATNDCKRIIVINPKPTNAASSSYYQRVIVPEKGSIIQIPGSTPTPEVVTIVYETPAPIAATPSPTLSLKPAKNPMENLIFWIVGAVVAIILAVLLFRKKTPPPPPRQQAGPPFIQPPPTV